MVSCCDQHWKQIKLLNDGRHLVVKRSLRDDNYEFKMSDHMRLWSETLTMRDMSSRFETLNQGMEVEEVELHRIFDEAFTNAKSKFSLNTSDHFNIANLEMNFVTYDIEMNWAFNCTIQSPEVLYHDLTMPMLGSLSFLLHEKATLLRILIDKDVTLEKMAKTENDSRGIKRKHIAFDQKLVEDAALNNEEFEEILKEDCRNIYTESFQQIFGNVERKLKQGKNSSMDLNPNRPFSGQCKKDERNGEQDKGACSGRDDRQEPTTALPPTSTDEEEEAQRRQALEKKLTEDSKKQMKKKKSIKF